ncbi:MAG: 2-succinylbenzoate--CoA ligase [Oscillatoriales cyanobacterium C42_A2020_001]|nr:2-succinylbenzoate--CoA ligase [Leptolyngbyaceae cyanobacterium C42_A2020_001]
MANPLALLQHRSQQDWLIGCNSQELAAIAHQIHQTLIQPQAQCDRPLTIFLAEPDPIRFLASFIAACSIPCQLFLCNPNWAESEWQQLWEMALPDLVLGEGRRQEGEGGKEDRADGEDRRQKTGFPAQHLGSAQQDSAFNPSFPSSLSSLSAPSPPTSLSPIPHPLILIPTGGSSGKLRYATHTWETLTASVEGFCSYFGVEQVNSLCVLPLYHVSGLMQFLRSLLSGGKFAIASFKSLQFSNLPPLYPPDFFLSLVPTQLHRLLTPPSPPSPLSPFQAILLGGAPAWTELLNTARQYHLPVAPTYGMTETASQIATLKPADFLRGRSGCGRVLPHAEVTIQDEDGRKLAAKQLGRIVIQAKSLMLGYFPNVEQSSELVTEDLGFLDEEGYLHVIGRRDGTIITGGENVYPTAVEAAIWQTGLVQDVCVVGLPDRDWGEVVTAVYVPTSTGQVDELKAAIAPLLSRYKHPKHWIAVKHLPRNAQGKLNRLEVMRLLSDYRPNDATTHA